MASSKRPMTVIIIDDSSDDEVASPRPAKVLRRNDKLIAPVFTENEIIPSDDFEDPETDMVEWARLLPCAKRRKSTPPSLSPEIKPCLAAQAIEVIPGSSRSAVLTQQDCFNQIIDVFPDVAHGHVLTLLEDNQNSVELVTNHLLESPNYPKETERRAAQQRARQAAQEAKIKAKLNLDAPIVAEVRRLILAILKDKFSTIPVTFIQNTQAQKQSLYATYMALYEAAQLDPLPYGKTRARSMREPNWIALRYDFKDHSMLRQLMDQYNTARNETDTLHRRRCKEVAEKNRELQNEQEAREAGTLAECAVCFGDAPSNRVILCDQDAAHPTCFECMANYIASEVGQSRCNIACPDSSGCSGTFTEPQLRTLTVDGALLDQLLRLQQERALRDAGVDDIESCPKCDFKKVCPPVEDDFEFRCQAPECGVTTCRKCNELSHIPDSCAQAKAKRSKDAALDLRHNLEEEMSKALIRSCNSCKKPFIKSDGCNKMTCPNCGHHQCYICSKSIEGYQHFTNNTQCPQFDQDAVEVRHAREVKEAEAAARAKIVAENPEVSKEHLEFELSETILQAEKAQAERLQAKRLHRDRPRGHPHHQRADLDRLQARLLQQHRHVPAQPIPIPPRQPVRYEPYPPIAPPPPPPPPPPPQPPVLQQPFYGMIEPPRYPQLPQMPQIPRLQPIHGMPIPPMPQMLIFPRMLQLPVMPQDQNLPWPNPEHLDIDGMIERTIRNLNPPEREADA